MSLRLIDHLQRETAQLEAAGLFKHERVITSPQDAEITVNGRQVINLCANNYLGLADHPALLAAAHDALDSHGFGMASVRFICGTQDLHKTLEARMSAFLGVEDTILYTSCFDANGGLFETLLGEGDAVISDALNHASIIDGIRLSKARRYRYANADMADLETQLRAAQDARFRLIVTDGVFSMDGIIAPLPAICDLAEKYDALVMVDDSHAVGFMGAQGGGTPQHFGVQDRVHLVTGTFGKALGGASGGYTAGTRACIDWLRQRSRPYLFSNTLAPAIAAASVAALDLIAREPQRLETLRGNAAYFRTQMQALGFDLAGEGHPIIPVMIYDAPKAKKFADMMLEHGVYVTAFSYPVVPQGLARIRTQMSAAHSRAQIDHAIAAFATVGRALGVIG